MNYSPSDLADRFTIVKLKVARQGKAFIKEYKALKSEVDALISSKVLDKKDLSRLYQINSKIWDLEARISSDSPRDTNYKKIAKLALQVRKWNTERTRVKAQIVAKTKKGFSDSKKFYFSGKK